MIARPKISRNEWKMTEIGASKVGNFAPFSCPGAIGTLRYVGMVTIILNDYPALKYVLVSIMGLFVLTNKEEA